MKGMARLALYDPRQGSPTRGLVNEFRVGDENPMLVVIPNHVYHGFKTISDTEAIMINIPTELYNHDNPDEYRVDPYDNDIPYDWTKDDGFV